MIADYLKSVGVVLLGSVFIGLLECWLTKKRKATKGDDK